MSEGFPAVTSRVDMKKYIDQIEEELRRVLIDIGPGKTPEEIEATQTRLQELIRRQTHSIAKEIGLTGSHVIVFMMASTIITTGWVAFALKRETLDLSKPPEDRLTLTDMLDALELALANVISAGSNYADISRK
ncbi:MAG: hypothetical protein OK438_00640 [Thaumarchaeota archaeon]|nr:hypothetical protein [Nitrososphaerota archaeon]